MHDPAVRTTVEGVTGSSLLLVFASVVGLTAYPPIAALWTNGMEGAFHYLAADSFYYLSIANRSLDAPFFTFDGIHPTNGFHPLWQIYLERGFFCFGLEGANQIWFAAISGIVLVSLGTGFFALALLRVTRRPALALLGAVPGLFYLVVPLLDPHYGSQWSFSNGMETPLSVLLFGLLAFVLFDRESLRPKSRLGPLVVISAILTLITLSRLDDIFLFAPFLLYLALSGETRSRAFQRISAMSTLPFLAIGAYLLFNLSYADGMLPSSGSAKSQPLWAFARNAYALLTTLVPMTDELVGRSNRAWSAEAWRIMQMVVPGLIGFWWLATRRMALQPTEDGSETERNTLIGLLAGYAFIKSGYNFATVSLWDQGHWYYPLTIMTFNLIVVVAIGRIFDRRQEASRERTPMRAVLARWPIVRRLPWATGAVFLVILSSANGFIDLKQRTRPATANFEFWKERASTLATLDAICRDCGLLSFDDGIVAYSLDKKSTMNGLGLVLDGEANQARRDGRLLDLAWHRGHRFIVSVNYPMAAEAYTTPEQLQHHLAQNLQLRGQQLDRWKFDVAFKTPTSGVFFILFSPRRDDLSQASR